MSFKINIILELTTGNIDGILKMKKLMAVNTDRIYELLLLTKGKTDGILKMMELSDGNTDRV